MILQTARAAHPASCRELMEIYDRYRGAAQRTNHLGDPVLYCLLADIDPQARALVTNIVHDCWRRVVLAFEPSAPIYPETVILAAIGVGGYQQRHADNMTLDEHGHWVPNHTPQRAFSALVYLNDDFEGGEIVFENQDVVIKPTAGLLVAFPSDQNYVHEVRPLRSGYRYSMPIWFTYDRSFAMSRFMTEHDQASPLSVPGA